MSLLRGRSKLGSRPERPASVLSKGGSLNAEQRICVGGRQTAWPVWACLLALLTTLNTQPALAAGQGDAPRLSLNTSIGRQLSPGDKDTFSLELQAGQFLGAHLSNRGFAIAIRFYRPDGRLFAELKYHRDRERPILLVTDAAGIHRVEVSSLEKEPGSGEYRLSIDEIRPASARDIRGADSAKSFAAGERLLNEATTESVLKAVTEYEHALTGWKAAADNRQQAIALRAIGEANMQLARPEKALQFYQLADRLARSTNDMSLQSDILNSLCVVSVHLGFNHNALSYSSRALKSSRGAGHKRGEAEALYNIGECYYAFGDLRKAREHYQQALDLWRSLGDRRGQAQTLLSLGYTHADWSESPTARKHYEEARSLWQAAGDNHGQGLVLVARAHLSSRLGERQEALALFNEALPIIKRAGDRVWEGSILGGIGYIYDGYGEKHRALEYYNLALARLKAARHQKAAAGSLHRVGLTYLELGDAPRALSCFQQSLEIGRSLADNRLISRAYEDLGMAHHSLRATDRALSYYGKALEVNRVNEDRRGEANTLNGIGRIHEASGRKDTALDFYRRALKLTQATGDRFGESATLYNIARAERDSGNFDGARSSIESALKLIESLRFNASNPELRASYLASVHNWVEFHIDLLMQNRKSTAEHSMIASALEASEAARARSLIDMLAEAQADIRRGVDPVLLERERYLGRQINLKEAARAVLLTGKHTPQQRSMAERELRGLLTEYGQVQGLIREKSPRYAALTQPVPLTLREIQQRVLDPETLLLEYSLGEQRSYLWAVSQSEIQSYELPGRAEIDAAAVQVYKLLTDPRAARADGPARPQARGGASSAGYADAAHQLSLMVLGPVASQLGNKRLLIVADGSLQYLPFGALPLPVSGAGGATQPRPPLMTAHEIVYLPSSSTLDILRRETGARKSAERGIAVFADPVFEEDDPRIGEQRPKATKSHFEGGRRVPQTDSHRAVRDLRSRRYDRIQRLQATGDEAKAILALMPQADNLSAIGFDANVALATGPEVGRCRIVHFATHGFVDAEHPALSGIVLSLLDREGQPQNGFLRLHDIYNLNLSADLVVLSACDTALGKQVRGEGLMGLTRGFMYAGAPRVVASLWKVDDEASLQLMKLFYSRMIGEGQRPAKALQQAQIEMWNRKRWQSPYYWAAFVLQGEWR
jgi:CHAT domain-containing protein/tetratricopeptide (TPR) repeat protein